jgi:3-methylfumaryl-CoA hydratase
MTDAEDRLEPGLIARFHATLGPWLFPMPEGAAPLGAHWCLFAPLADTAVLGPDGHPPRLHAVSAADFPRRMWVGGALDLAAPFPLDTPVSRRTGLRPAQQRTGTSGRFLLAGFDQHYSAAGRLLGTERQDIVYRPAFDGSAPPEPARGPIPASDLRLEIPTPAALLVRYSALTFNAHLIHVSDAHATGVEGHEGLLVHGPLQATILLNLAARGLGTVPGHFRYRAVQPLVAGRGLVATATHDQGAIRCAVHDESGRQTMVAEARAR